MLHNNVNSNVFERPLSSFKKVITNYIVARR